MFLIKKRKKYDENKLAEMVALVGGAMKYIELYGNLNGYDKYYMENKCKESFHYRMQNYANKIIIKDLNYKRIHCRRWKVKTFYRYRKKDHNRIDIELYYYFTYIMDYILNYSILTDILTKNILQDCKYAMNIDNSEKKDCLDTILDWNYKRLLKFKANILILDEKKREKSNKLLDMLNTYPRFEIFRGECQRAHQDA